MTDASHHDDVTLCAGDDWAIIATLLDIDGTPLDLTQAGLMWTLIGPDGKVAIPENSADLDTGEQPKAGIVVISVPHAVTAALGPGRYMDALRVIVSDYYDRVSTGTILVDANMFSIGATP